MKQMFTSATVKLTAWYLLILMSISLLFSVIIYQISQSELDSRFDSLSARIERQEGLTPQNMQQFEVFRDGQLHESETKLFIALLYTNLFILLAGGLGSYVLARRSLLPIEQSHEAQSRFTSDASHELRTPLAVMKSELEVALRSGKLSKQDMHELLESNLEEVNRMSELSDMLLKLSREDYTNMEVKQLDVAKLLEKIVKAHEKKDAGRFSLALESSGPILGNQPSIQELVMILLHNAVGYSPPGSPIHIYTKERGGMLLLEITKEGKGISATDLPHVFERFYRGEKSRTSSNSGGYGLGLSLAKKIADIHDATIKISSNPGKITSVVATFKKISEK